MKEFPYIFYDYDEWSLTRFTFCVRDIDGSIDGLTLQEAQRIIKEIKEN